MLRFLLDDKVGFLLTSACSRRYFISKADDPLLKLQVCRRKLMQFSRIRSKSTYDKCIRELATDGYITMSHPTIRFKSAVFQLSARKHKTGLLITHLFHSLLFLLDLRFRSLNKLIHQALYTIFSSYDLTTNFHRSNRTFCAFVRIF
jgi:hypothetical protein